MKTDFQINNDPDSWQRILSFLAQLPEGEYKVTVTNQKVRTRKQQAAIEVYCRQLAEAMADSGIDFRQVVQFPIPPTQALVKDNIWRPCQLALYPNKPSTKQIDTNEVNEVYRVVDHGISERCGISIPFPSLQEQAFEALTDA